MNLGNEPLWAIEFYKLYESRNIEDIKKRLFEISDVLIYLHEILAERKVDLPEKDIYSEQLVIKLHLQNLSLLDLSKGHSISSRFYDNKSSDIKFLDLSSIITIVRSQYETLLMYQHLYVNPEDENEQKLRYESWIMSSMMLRSKVFSQSKFINNERVKSEQDAIERLKNNISNNEFFQKLTEKQQRSLLENGSGKLFKNWDTIFSESKFSDAGVFSKLYYNASVYAHSEGLVVLQLKETKHLMEHEHMKETLYLMLFYSYLMTSIMIKNIVNKYPLVKERYDSLDEKTKFEIDFNYQLSFKS
ncbi:hypothetical protein SAMN05421856_11039 [Chryseobacterium taichungense]|uniref:Uncharacterized protein n=2 Tax=Chryseobacterium TaxID=59732 RepID=A0AAD0YEK4_9FLAO|nr:MULTISPECIES: hypothetical protein [Chryseobacterium]MCT4319242.1 hypothetical protein [Elizabethkingia anophelis]AZA87595.1 hypothetical protein EG349_12740 [Chryseobacterium shandongense]AZA96094.1 hypothetical protein EG353_11200 [Chryseobacterium shandongense]MEB4760219.1 hypothetical protein [Chryseobacterium indologenes]UMQ40563.1 hypothetical protein MKS83_14285 [Chryseobacterium sp. Y16C]